MSQPQLPEIGRVLIVGGNGRLGRLLRLAWGHLGQTGLIWQHRREGALVFDPLDEPDRYAAAAKGVDAIFNLAGSTGPSGSTLGLNTELALAALKAAAAASVPRVFLASSAAVYGPTSCGHEEDSLCPASAYGQEKHRMECAALNWAGSAPAPAVTCLRIGNVAGADQLLGRPPGPGPQVLDVFEGGTGPARSYIGPLALAKVLSGLFATAGLLPSILNLALEGTVGMEELLDADQRPWIPRAAPKTVASEVRLDVTRLGRIVPVSTAAAAGIVADLRTIVRRPGL